MTYANLWRTWTKATANKTRHLRTLRSDLQDTTRFESFDNTAACFCTAYAQTALFFLQFLFKIPGAPEIICENCCFLSHLVPFGSGIFRDMFKPVFCCRGTLQEFFVIKQLMFEFWGVAILQKSEFSSNARFLGHLSGEISHESGPYGPYGPF